jgi:hypothetical protein
LARRHLRNGAVVLYDLGSSYVELRARAVRAAGEGAAGLAQRLKAG